jgi:catechol 2,3-dioxygenase-like lactoylglutathione lyase family enzyme
MTTSTPARVGFGRAAPTISVTDIPRAMLFYVDILGFTETFRNGDPVGFVILKRDDAELHLSRSSDHQATVQNVAHLLVDDARKLYDHLIAHDVRVVKRLRDAPYGIRGFVVADPDGNRIDVGQPL